MKTYLIVCAMEEELSAFFEGLSFMKETHRGIETYAVRSERTTIYGMLGGIGKVSMAYRLGKILGDIMDVDEVINVGVAGSLSPKLPPLKTLVADRCAYHDVDVTAFGYTYGQMAGEPLFFECDKEEVKRAKTIDPENIVTGLILSGDSFMTKEKIKNSSCSLFKEPLAIDMESAAVAQVCTNEKIPFLIIRSISDDAEGNQENREQYDRLLKEASLRAGRIARKLVL